MIFELGLGIGLAIIIIAFIAEYADSTLGMGYGTMLTPLLLLMGFEPLQVVPIVLFSELITGLLAGFTHHSVGNVDFRPKTMNVVKIYRAIKELGFKESFKRGIPFHLKAALLIASCSIIGTVSAVFIAISLPKFYLNLYIGLLVLAIGLFILATVNKNYRFSWKKMTALGLIASFNKGISGGGYGPVVTGGQLLSGIDGKNAVGITSLAEGLTCAVGVLIYFLTKNIADWSLAPYIITGAVISVPFSAISVKKIKTKNLKILIGVITVVLGAFTIIKLF
ncbi:sulfite exporter TauE/SafE family protein [Candidatus Woesearchaeota archaeon]|nr:sulfite exporter TauE/SafE family protein [Candidatus Woesearchaeota archaeon]